MGTACALLALAAVAPALADDVPKSAKEPPAKASARAKGAQALLEANRKSVQAFYEAALNQKDFEAASRYLGPQYKQHNPRAADGMEGFRAFIKSLRDNTPQSHSEILRAFADGDYVILHVHKVPRPGERGVAIVDIFRLEGGKIVEHWDVTQEVPEKTVSGNPMF